MTVLIKKVFTKPTLWGNYQLTLSVNEAKDGSFLYKDSLKDVRPDMENADRHPLKKVPFESLNKAVNWTNKMATSYKNDGWKQIA